jgi:MFS family permease
LFAKNLGNTFSSLRGNRALQIYLLSQMARLWAWAALQVAISWLIYSATKSNLILAWVSFGNFLPMLLLGMSGGYVADRFNRKHILLLTQSLNIVLMLSFAYLTHDAARPLWAIAFLYVLVGVVFAHDQPVRQALIMNLIPPHQRVNAFCCEMIVSTLTMMASFSIAGKVIANYGESACFISGAVSLVVATILLLFVNQRKEEDNDTEEKAGGETKGVNVLDAIRYVMGNADVRRIFFHNCIALLVGTKYSLLFPAITTNLLHGNARVLGDLDAANSIGGTLAGLVLANLVLAPKWGGPYAAMAGSFLLLALAQSNSFVASAVTVVFLGLFFTLQNNGNYAVLQTIVPDRMRGRTIAAYLVVTQLVDQVGNFFTGRAADRFGVQPILLVEGVICAAIFAVISIGRFKERGEIREEPR